MVAGGRIEPVSLGSVTQDREGHRGGAGAYRYGELGGILDVLDPLRFGGYPVGGAEQR